MTDKVNPTNLCINCRWWKQGYRVPGQKRGEGWISEFPDGDRVYHGDCRKNAPSGNGLSKSYPITHEDDWCGEFQPASDTCEGA